MPHLHFARTVHKSGGSAASARIGYLTGQGAKDPTATPAKAPQKPDREDLIYARSANLPAWAKGNPHTYFRAAERYERPSPQNDLRRGVAFEEWKITLPQELSQAKNKDLMRDIVDAVAGDRLPITYAFHNPPTTDKRNQQPHLHLLISARINDGYSRTPEQHFKRYNRTNPAQGGAQKDPTFWHKGAIKAHRELLSDLMNLHLEWAGVAGRVHPDSLSDRGMPRRPEPKLLPSESRAYREQGIISPRVQEVLDIRQERASLVAREQGQAGTYWETRKTTLGITPGMSKHVQRKAVLHARTQRVARPPAPPLPTHQLQSLARRVTTLLGRETQARGHWKLDIQIDPEVQERGRG